MYERHAISHQELGFRSMFRAEKIFCSGLSLLTAAAPLFLLCILAAILGSTGEGVATGGGGGGTIDIG